MEKNLDNKNKIVDIALNLFAEYGFDSVGVQTICEKSGITKPTLYYYFGNKEGVLKEVLAGNYEKLNSLLVKASKYTPNPEIYEKDVFFTLVNVADTYLKFAKKNPKFYQIVLYSTFAPNSGTTCKMAKELNQIQYSILESMFKSFSKQHWNMRGSEKRLAWSFIGLVNTFIALNTGDSTKSIVKQFMHGIFS